MVCPRKDFALAARGRRLAETPYFRGDCGRQCRNATGVELQTCSSDTPLAPPPCPCLSTNHPVNKTSRADEGNEHVPSLPRAVHSRAAASRPPRHRDTPSPERHGTTASYESQSRPRTEQTVCTVRVDARRAESLLNQSPHRLVEVPTPPRPPGRCSPRREPCNPSHPATRTPTAPHAVHGMPNRTIPPSPPPCCRRPGPLCTSRNGRTSAPPNTLNRTRATPPPERSPTVAGRDSHPLRDGAFSRRTRPAVLVALTCIDRQRTHRSLPWCLPPGRQRRTQGNADNEPRANKRLHRLHVIPGRPPSDRSPRRLLQPAAVLCMSAGEHLLHQLTVSVNRCWRCLSTPCYQFDDGKTGNVFYLTIVGLLRGCLL